MSGFGRTGAQLQPIVERARSLRTAVAGRGERLLSASGHAFSADVVASCDSSDVLLEVHRAAPDNAIAAPGRWSESLR